MVQCEYNFSMAIFDCELNSYCTLFFLGYSNPQCFTAESNWSITSILSNPSKKNLVVWGRD